MTEDDDELTTKHVDPRLHGHLTDLLAQASELHLVAMDLLVVDGPDAGARFRLGEGTTRLGTSAGCLVRLTDKTVSRVHCELELDKSSVHVVDAGSTNGTTIDSVSIKRADLRPGPLLRVGSSALRLQRSDEPLVVPLSKLDHYGPIGARLLGRSVEMRRIYAILERAEKSDVTVLVQGETGTGKDIVARALHAQSSRKKGPFVAIDCGSIAENLIESELFGHARGAFSGAVAERTGLFEEANGGTLFLDEVGELPLSLQPKLLRALESREVRRVGSNLARKVDVRIVAATNRPLARAVNEGTFREDLFYRLAVVEIHLPPLRARCEDIPVLAQHFHDRLTGSPSPLPEGLMRSLGNRGWPGNVRELRNFVERIVSLGWMPTEDGSALPRPDTKAKANNAENLDIAPLISTELPLKEAREAWNARFEQLYLRALLARSGGNVRRAAELAGVNRRWLQRLLAQYGGAVDLQRGDSVDSGEAPPDDDPDTDPR